MIDPDRLSELSTLDPADLPDDAKVRIDVMDLRDLVRLIPVVRAALAINTDIDGGRAPYDALDNLAIALDELQKGRG